MERLRRLEQLYLEAPVYFITFCTEGRSAILDCRRVHEMFIEFCKRALKRDIFVGRYILMPDHIHLSVKLPPPTKNLSGWIKSLKNFLSKSLTHSGQASPHWQKGFFDHVLRANESYSEKRRYMAENAVRDGLVKSLTEWPYQREIHALKFSK